MSFPLEISIGMNKMFTTDEKKKMVEYGIKEFNLHPDFLTWLIDEFNNTYDAILEEKLKAYEQKIQPDSDLEKQPERKK